MPVGLGAEDFFDALVAAPGHEQAVDGLVAAKATGVRLAGHPQSAQGVHQVARSMKAARQKDLADRGVERKRHERGRRDGGAVPESQAAIAVVAPDIDASSVIQASEHAIAVPVVAGEDPLDHGSSWQLAHAIDTSRHRIGGGRGRAPVAVGPGVPQAATGLDKESLVPHAGDGRDARRAGWKCHPRGEGATDVTGVAGALLAGERPAPGTHRAVVHERGHEEVGAVVVGRRAVGVHQRRGHRAVAIGHEAEFHTVHPIGAIRVQHHAADATHRHPTGEQVAFERCILLAQRKGLRLAVAHHPGATFLEDHIPIPIAQVGRVEAAPAVAQRRYIQVHSCTSRAF